MIRALLIILAIGMTACSSTLDLTRYADQKPRFDPMAFFAGRTLAEGVFETRDGAPARRFTQVIDGSRDGETLLIDQVFTYEDGELETRTWRLTEMPDGTFQAVSTAAAGPGIGRVFGDVFLWEWTYAARPGNPLANLHVRQIMYRHDRRHATNRAVVTKFGIQVAQVTERFVKP